jgi:hypothetical protein
VSARPEASSGWRRYFFSRREVVKTTWALRLTVVVLPVVLMWLTSGLWVPSLGRGLVCAESNARGDAIIVENFDQQYLPFERAAELLGRGVAPMVLVPTLAFGEPAEPNLVSARIVEVMAGVAQLKQFEVIPVHEVEPVTLNVAYQIREFLERAQVRSAVVVIPAFRSRRSALVYSAVFSRAGIETQCVPVFGKVTPETWAETWHGMLQVAEQYAKLAYYRLYVMPRFLYAAGA